jgi:hypothetical protein
VCHKSLSRKHIPYIKTAGEKAHYTVRNNFSLFELLDEILMEAAFGYLLQRKTCVLNKASEAQFLNTANLGSPTLSFCGTTSLIKHEA